MQEFHRLWGVHFTMSMLKTSYLHNGIFCTGKMTSLDWTRPLLCLIRQWNVSWSLSENDITKQVFLFSYSSDIPALTTWGDTPRLHVTRCHSTLFMGVLISSFRWKHWSQLQQWRLSQSDLSQCLFVFQCHWVNWAINDDNVEWMMCRVESHYNLYDSLNVVHIYLCCIIFTILKKKRNSWGSIKDKWIYNTCPTVNFISQNENPGCNYLNNYKWCCMVPHQFFSPQWFRY